MSKTVCSFPTHDGCLIYKIHIMAKETVWVLAFLVSTASRTSLGCPLVPLLMSPGTCSHLLPLSTTECACCEACPAWAAAWLERNVLRGTCFPPHCPLLLPALKILMLMKQITLSSPLKKENHPCINKPMIGEKKTVNGMCNVSLTCVRNRDTSTAMHGTGPH